MHRKAARRGVLGFVLFLVCAGLTAPASASTLISTRIGHEHGIAIPRSFLGFSSDWNVVSQLVGNDAGPNPVYQQLLANLTRYGGGTPVLRVGGYYQDAAWWNPGDLRPDYEHGIFVNIRPATLTSLARNAGLTGQKMILGINLGANDPSLVRDEAKAIVANIPRRSIAGLEIGNEPDFYPNRPAFEKRDANGRLISTLYTRKRRNWNASTYMRQWERMAGTVRSVSPRLPLVGTSGYGQIVSAARFVKRERSRLAFYTEHAYPLAGCAPKGRVYTPKDKQYPTVSKLLGAPGAYTTVPQEKLGAAAAHRFHKRYVISEMNSVSCTVRPEVAGSFAATLWALDQFFLQAALGVDGINLHVDSPVKTPFQFTSFQSGDWAGAANPLYYAFLTFEATAGRAGRLLFSPTFGARTKANARVWAVRAGKRLRVLVVNKDLKRGGTVRVAVPGSRAGALLERLSAPGITATSGVSFAGQAVASPTFDGKLEGALRTQAVRASKGVYSFTMPRASAALLTIG